MDCPARRKLPWRPVVGGVVVFASALFLWRFPWSSALGTLATASLPMLALTLVVKAAAIYGRAERMHAMMHRELAVGRGALLRYLLCAFAADNLVASTAGVAVRGLLLHKQGGVRGKTVVGALAFEKYFDGCFMGAGIWVGVHWHLVPVPFPEHAFDLAYVIGFALMVGALLCPWLWPGSRLGRFFAPVRSALGNWRDAARTLALTAGIWTTEIVVLMLTLRSLGVTLALTQVIALTTIGTLAFVIPGLPSGAGTFEAGLVFGLCTMGLGDGVALSAALLYHAVQVLPATIAGLFALRGVGMGLRDARRAEVPNVAVAISDG